MVDPKSTQPRVITAAVYLLWSAPITYLIALAALYNLPSDRIFDIFLSFYYWGRSGFAVFVGFALLRKKPWAWQMFVIHLCLMMGEQFYVASVYAENYNSAPSVLIALFAICLYFILVRLEYRVPYYSPQIAWWESDPRYRINLSGKLTAGGEKLDTQIMDISSSGCFLKLPKEFSIDQFVTVNFSLYGTEFECSGKVVWRAESTITHPKGIGVRFVEMNRDEQALLKKTVKQLRNESHKLRKDRRDEKTSRIEEKIREDIVDKNKLQL